MQVGCPWRDLPSKFGRWRLVYQPFNRWSSKNKWMTIFKSLLDNPDLEWECIDGNVVKVRQHSLQVLPVMKLRRGPLVAENTTKSTWQLTYIDDPLILK